MMSKSSPTLKKWEPNFNPKDWEFNEAPIWVCLPELPLEYWNEEIFSGLAACFGELLPLDPMTVAKKILVYI